jgi:hypothetical protein
LYSAAGSALRIRFLTNILELEDMLHKLGRELALKSEGSITSKTNRVYLQGEPELNIAVLSGIRRKGVSEVLHFRGRMKT